MHRLGDITDRSIIREVVLQLERLSRCHFVCEEWLMAAYDYPEYRTHVAEHANLVAEIRGYESNVVFRPEKFALVLSNWLISHTMQDDRPLANHILTLRNQGIEVTPDASLFDTFTRTALELGLNGVNDESDDSP
jgi:hemerythrin-like metal-binding protein